MAGRIKAPESTRIHTNTYPADRFQSGAWIIIQQQHRAHRVVGQLDVDDQEGGYPLVALQRMVARAQLRGLGQHHVLRYVVDLLLEGVDVHAQQLAAAARPSAGQKRRC